MGLQPVFLKLEGRSGLVVGAGAVAADKIAALIKAGSLLRVVAPRASDQVQRLAAEGKIEWIQKPFEPSDLDGVFIAIAATDLPEVNAAVYREARQRGILSNSVDDIPNCDFFFGSVVSRGELQIAISTAGESPALAQRLRKEIDEQLPEDLGPWLDGIGGLRREVLATHPKGEERRLLLHQLARRDVCDSVLCPTRGIAHGKTGAEPGRVYLVGAGPGDPELLTVKAVRLIESADVILHDDLVTGAVLELARPKTEVVNVGKRCGEKSIFQSEINALMVEHARRGRSVVRLKSGDPMLFGRAAEEMAALAEFGIEYEIVPGISAAFAAAAAAGCSLTERGCASSVILTTASHAQPRNQSANLELDEATRVVYMPGRDLKKLAEAWIAEGIPSELPCALVSRAAQQDESVVFSTLGALGEVEPPAAPSLLLAGWAVRQRAGTGQDRSIGVPAVPDPAQNFVK